MNTTNLEHEKSLLQLQLYLIKTPLCSLREATWQYPHAHSLQWPAFLSSVFMETVGPLVNVRKRFKCQRDTKNMPTLHLPYWTLLDGKTLHLCMMVRFPWQYFKCKPVKVECRWRYCCCIYFLVLLFQTVGGTRLEIFLQYPGAQRWPWILFSFLNKMKMKIPL